MLNINDSTTLKNSFRDLTKEEIENLDKTIINDLTLSKFRFSITNKDQIDSFQLYVAKLAKEVKERNLEIYTIHNYHNEETKHATYIVQNIYLAKHEDLLFSYNILADYSAGSMKIKYTKKFQKEIMKELESLSEEEYKEKEEEIQKRFKKNGKQKFVEPQLRSFIVEIFLVYKDNKKTE